MLIWTTNIGCISAYSLLFILLVFLSFILKTEKYRLICFSWTPLQCCNIASGSVEHKFWKWSLMDFLFFFFFLAACGCLQAVQLLCEYKCPINIKDLVRTSFPIGYLRAFTTLHSSQSQVQQFKAILCFYFFMDFSGRGSSFCSLP